MQTTSQDYSNSFRVNKTAADVFDALTQKIPKWWSADFEGNAANVGDKFTVRFGKTFKTLQVEEMESCNKIAWRCVDQYIDHPDIHDQTEWIGTLIVWTIVPENFSVKVNVQHLGLIPSAECYSICEKGWDAFITSLFALLEGGDGLPFMKKVN